MANQLAMDKSFAIHNLRAAGYSERRIAQMLGVSRGSIRRHLRCPESNSTTAPTAPSEQAPTGSDDSNSTKAPTGSSGQSAAPEAVDAAAPSGSQCEPFREIILAKCELGLSAKRIHQDLVADYGFDGKYWSVNRFVRSVGANHEAPFRRMEVEPGEELQVDFGTGAKIRGIEGTYRRTHVFRCILSRSRKGYTEAVFKQDTESFIRTLENTFRTLGGVPKRVVFDNAKCAVKTPDWYDPELNPKLIDFCKHYGCAFIPTRVRTPRHKGKVERGVDYVQEKISPIERGIGYLDRKMRLIGPHSSRWAEAVIAGRGVEASRVLQGVLAMSRKHSSKEIEQACQTAWRSGAINCRIIRTLLKRQSPASQTTMEFMEDHAIIRPIGEYANFIHTKVQEGIHQ